jgi:hypothetical protein
MLLAAQEAQRGWGGPIALLVFAIVASVFYWLMETYGPASKIHNHSPTEDWIEGEEEFHQLTDARGAGEGNCGGGVVDHGSWRSYKECECGRCDMTPRHELP